MKKSLKTGIILLVTVLFASIALSLKLGQTDLSLTELLRAFGADKDELTADIVLHLRLPRVLFTAFVGSGLALCGYVMQTSVQNPLADPYILGISSGASLGATFSILSGINIYGIGQELMVSVSAFMGALLAIASVYACAAYKGRLTTTHLLLAGVIVNTLFTAIGNMLIYSAKDIEGIRNITFWTMGSLANVSWVQVWGLGGILLICICYFLTQLRALNGLSLGDDTAITLGINATKKRKTYTLMIALLTGIMVAQCGIIGFVGLIVPHAVRAIFKTANSAILPVVLLSGSIFLILADVLARTLLQHQEIPIGIITSIIGAPIFLIVFLKQNYGS